MMWKTYYFTEKYIEGIHHKFYKDNYSKISEDLDLKKIRKKSGK